MFITNIIFLFLDCCNETTTTTTRYLKYHMNSVELYKVVLPCSWPTLYSPNSSTFQPPSMMVHHTALSNFMYNTSHSASLRCLKASSSWIFGTFAAHILCQVFLPYNIYIYANTHQHLHCQNPLFPKLCTFKLLTNTPRIAEKACYVEVTAVLHCGWMSLRSRGPALHFQLEHFCQNCEKSSRCKITSFYCMIYKSLRR